MMNSVRGITLRDLDAGMAYRLTLLISSEDMAVGALLQRWRMHVEWPVVVMSLTPAHNTPTHFKAALVRCLAPWSGLSPQETHGLSLEETVIELLNGLTALSETLAFVLQGYDAIDTADVHEAVSIMLDYLPPQVHVVITASAPPPLACAPRLRVRRQLLELGG